MQSVWQQEVFEFAVIHETFENKQYVKYT
jgi:hypothetical protein